MNKFIRVLFLTALLLTFVTVASYAADSETVAEVPEVTLESFMELFDLSPVEVAYKGSEITYPMNAVEPDMNQDVPDFALEMVDTVNYDVIGGFELSTGFGDHDITTFAYEKNLVGQGASDMVVGVAVYTIGTELLYDEDGEFTGSETVYDVSFSSVKVLGASGLYSEVLRYEENTEQYVTLIVRDGMNTPYYRTFRVTTIEEETKVILENIEINFIEDDFETEVPEVDSFIDWFGLSQEIEF